MRSRSGWTALLLSAAARALLVAVGSLLLWSVAPALVGWHPTVVMSGSMEPRLSTGDVVVSRPVPADKLSPGQVLLVDDPDRAGELRLHRFARYAADGRLVLRGDANRQDDSSPVRPSAVHGVGVLRIPWIGRPVLWVQHGEVVPLVLLVLACGA